MLENMTASTENMDLKEKHSHTDTLEEHVENPPATAPGTSEEAHVTLKTWSVILVGGQ